jgi:hypothetical protein
MEWKRWLPHAQAVCVPRREERESLRALQLHRKRVNRTHIDVKNRKPSASRRAHKELEPVAPLGWYAGRASIVGEKINTNAVGDLHKRSSSSKSG